MASVRESSARPAQEEPVPDPKHRIPGDLQGALHHVKVPCYFVDRFGVIRWINHATRDLVGDVRGRQQSSVVAPEQAREARESFTRKMLGTERSTNATVVVVGKDG
ncbi:MAG TPA: PAS domain-containing protein, partial [Gaiellaceae bacterium]